MFESKRPTHQLYAIRELQYVHTVREHVVEQVTGSTPVRVCSTGMAGLSVALAVMGWPIMGYRR